MRSSERPLPTLPPVDDSMVRQAINEYEMWADPEMGMEAALKVVRQTFLMHLEAAHQ